MKKILVLIDGSEPSVKAAKQAALLAKTFSSKLTFLTVVGEQAMTANIENVSMAEDYYALIKETTEQEKKYAANLLDSIVGSLDCEGIQTEKKVVVGYIFTKIIEVAEEGKYDLIVMGHRGLNPIKRIFIGSVAKNIIEHAPCSVLIEK